ncbi:MAG: hypothetical protein A2030_04045, partial [Chloroflexi bacterium RBG_19FT_COMBO_50_10]
MFIDLLGLQKEGSVKLTGCRVALLQAALIAGVLIVIQSEIFSLFHALSLPTVAIAWLVALLISVLLGIRKGLLNQGWRRLIKGIQSLDWFTAVTLIGFILISLLLLVIVVIAPPNNTDSLLYHMSRVMHWAQDRSIAHYPVGFEPQLTNPIGAELIILQLRLLWGNDQLASLPQWFSLILCAIGVSLGAKLLGAGRRGQLSAAAFAISIPMGLLQATSTQNDYVTAVWLTIMAIFILIACQAEPGWAEILSISAALGLGLLTKGTFYPYAVPWGIWLGINWLKKRKPLLFLKRSLLVVLVVIFLNAGYWMRNFITYGGPFGSATWVSSMTSAEKGVLKPLASNLVKNIALNLATPSDKLNDTIVNYIKSNFQASDPDVVSFQLYWRWNHEDIAGNPLHLILVIIIVAAAFLLVTLKHFKERYLLWYIMAAIFSFIIFVLTTHFDQYGVRYQLPLMVIWAPVFGIVITNLSERRLAPLAIIFFLAISLPYVFFNSTRPLIAMKNGPEPYAIHTLPGLEITKSSSIFFADQQMLLFANWPDLRKPYTEITQAIRDYGCRQVGLRIDSHDMEYPFWWLLKAPQSGIRIESIYYSDQLRRYADPNFKPCAIICTICDDRTRLHGLDLFDTYDAGMKLFTGNSYS